MSEGGRYTIKVTPHAERSLKKLARDQEMLARIDQRIRSLAQDPRPPDCKELKSSKHGNLYRVRVGNWRVLYAAEDDVVLVLILDVVRRDQAYR